MAQMLNFRVLTSIFVGGRGQGKGGKGTRERGEGGKGKGGRERGEGKGKGGTAGLLLSQRIQGKLKYFWS